MCIVFVGTVMTDFGQSVFGQSVFGQSVVGQSVVGQLLCVLCVCVVCVCVCCVVCVLCVVCCCVLCVVCFVLCVVVRSLHLPPDPILRQTTLFRTALFRTAPRWVWTSAVLPLMTFWRFLGPPLHWPSTMSRTMATSKMKETSIEKKQKHKIWDKQYSPCFCENVAGVGRRRFHKNTAHARLGFRF